MLTTTSGAQPSILYERLLNKPEKVNEIVGRLEVQHGNILEHNRLIWKVEATPEYVLEILLQNRFFKFTKLNDSSWLVSSNLRTVVEYILSNENEFSKRILESLECVAPLVYNYVKRSL
jgi:hypothetical protein